jgi:hypothetical protein
MARSVQLNGVVRMDHANCRDLIVGCCGTGAILLPSTIAQPEGIGILHALIAWPMLIKILDNEVTELSSSGSTLAGEKVFIYNPSH